MAPQAVLNSTCSGSMTWASITDHSLWTENLEDAAELNFACFRDTGQITPMKFVKEGMRLFLYFQDKEPAVSSFIIARYKSDDDDDDDDAPMVWPLTLYASLFCC